MHKHTHCVDGTTTRFPPTKKGVQLDVFIVTNLSASLPPLPLLGGRLATLPLTGREMTNSTLNQYRSLQPLSAKGQAVCTGGPGGGFEGTGQCVTHGGANPPQQ